MKPPFTITNDILNLSTDITLLLGKYEGLSLPTGQAGLPIPKPELRKHTKIRTIQSSLAIEGNTLTIEQVTDIINNKRVVGPKKDILEVKNAIKAYDHLPKFDPESLKSLLMAHKILMEGIIPNAGKLRIKNVGVHSGTKIIHMAPKYTQVPQLIDNLFQFLKNEKNLHPLIKSSAFHYELEFIHPFIDGNGRIGRLWQSVILYHYRNVFEYIPVETAIKNRQGDYYDALQESNKLGESTVFIHFMLEIIKQATLDFAKEVKPKHQTSAMRIEMAKERFGKKEFTRKDYLVMFDHISTATASRDLLFGVKSNILNKRGEKSLTKYKFV